MRTKCRLLLSPKEGLLPHKNISNNTTMSVTIIVHTENLTKLTELFNAIKRHRPKTNFSIRLNAKGYSPWEDNFIKNEIMSFTKYEAFPTNKDVVESVIEMVTKVTTKHVLILDENCGQLFLNEWMNGKYDLLYTEKKDIIKLNLDSKYQTIKWFIIDLLSQKSKSKIDVVDDSKDCIRYNKKIENPIFYDKIIYLDGGMGDHVMGLPLLEKIHKDVHICCKYPAVFEHLEFKGHIHWNEELFGGYRRFVYEQGSTNNSKTIIDAFFELYGYTRNSNDVLRYNGLRESNSIQNDGKKIALICSSAAIVQGQESNKNWRELRWLKLVNELQQRGYYVIQVGTSNDNQIPMVDMKFLDQPLSKLASLVDECSLWVSVDTFFHHFAAAIKPNVGICLTPFYNDHAKHIGVKYVEKDCGKDFSSRKWWLDLQQPERKECMDLIQLNDVVSLIPEMVIVQLGSNNGYDGLTKFINDNNLKMFKCILVEPNKLHNESLLECYKKVENVIIENVAVKPPYILEDKVEIFYHINDGPKYEVASMVRSHVEKHYNGGEIKSFIVKSITIEELLDKHNLINIDWLLIDVEGLDAELVLTFNWSKYNIKKIDIEHLHLGDKKQEVFDLFEKMNYKQINGSDLHGYDIGFIK